jgi:hypothetical protein
VLAGRRGVLLTTAPKGDLERPSLPGDDDLRGLSVGRTTRTTLWHYDGAVAFTALAVLPPGLLDDEDRRRRQEAGFDHQMVKPVDPNALMKQPAAPKAQTAWPSRRPPFRDARSG